VRPLGKELSLAGLTGVQNVPRPDQCCLSCCCLPFTNVVWKFEHGCRNIYTNLCILRDYSCFVWVEALAILVIWVLVAELGSEEKHAPCMYTADRFEGKGCLPFFHADRLWWRFIYRSCQNDQAGFGHEAIQEKSSRVIICTRLQIASRIFFVSIGTVGLRRFSGRANSSFSKKRKRIVPGQVWIPLRSSGSTNTGVWIFETNQFLLVPRPGNR